jgi:hypothetical protein
MDELLHFVSEPFGRKPAHVFFEIKRMEGLFSVLKTPDGIE